MKTTRLLLPIAAAVLLSSSALGTDTPQTQPAPPAAGPAAGAAQPVQPRCDMKRLQGWGDNPANSALFQLDVMVDKGTVYCNPEIIKFISVNPGLRQSFTSASMSLIQVDLMKAVAKKFQAVDEGAAKVSAAAAAVYKTAAALKVAQVGADNSVQLSPVSEVTVTPDQLDGFKLLVQKEMGSVQSPGPNGTVSRIAPAQPGDQVAAFYSAYLDFGKQLNALKDQQPGKGDLQYNCTIAANPLNENTMAEAEKTISAPKGALDSYDPKIGAGVSKDLQQVNAIFNSANRIIVDNKGMDTLTKNASDAAAAAKLQAQQKQMGALGTSLGAGTSADINKFFDAQNKANPLTPDAVQAVNQNLALAQNGKVTQGSDGGYQYTYTHLDGSSHVVPLGSDLSKANVADASQKITTDVLGQATAANLLAGKPWTAAVSTVKAVIATPPPDSKPGPVVVTPPTPGAKVDPSVLTPPPGANTDSASLPLQKHSFLYKLAHPLDLFRSDPQRYQAEQEKALAKQAATVDSLSRQKIEKQYDDAVAKIKASSDSPAVKAVNKAQANLDQKKALADLAAQQAQSNQLASDATKAHLNSYYGSKILSAQGALQNKYLSGSYTVQRSPKQGGPLQVSVRDQAARDAGVPPAAVTDAVIQAYFAQYSQKTGAIQAKLNLGNPSADNVDNKFVHDDLVQYLKTTLNGAHAS